MGSGSSYQVRAVFANASQIVSGDLVEVAGSSIGTVSNISLTPSGQAQLTLDITNKSYNPLHQGTQATIRELSPRASPAATWTSIRDRPGIPRSTPAA